MMHQMLLMIILFLSLNTNADPIISVCDRTPAVRDKLVRLTKKSCLDIDKADLAKIELLDFAGESVDSLNGNDFDGLDNVKSLYLNDTSLTFIQPMTFGNLPRLQTLNLADCNLALFHALTFLGPNSLRHLILSGNKIAGFPFLNGFENLETLDLSRNRIGEIASDAFSESPKLHTLNLSNNKLKQLPSGFASGLKALRKLDLSGNLQLRTISDGEFAQNSTQETIDVRSCPLTKTRKAAFRGVGNVIGLPANFDQDDSPGQWGGQ